MPRARKPGSGGPRQGTPGTNYPNRQDLARPTLPVQAVPNQPYGQAGAQIAAQHVVPLPNTTGTPAPSPTPQAPVQQAQGPLPGTLPFAHPTQRPNEPIHAGMPTGPGPGPEVLSGPSAGQPNTAKQLLTNLANQPGATDAVRQLASYVQAGRS